MRVIIYCKSQTAMKRVKTAMERQKIEFRQEKQTIPSIVWVFEAVRMPSIKNPLGITYTQENISPSFLKVS